MIDYNADYEYLKLPKLEKITLLLTHNLYNLFDVLFDSYHHPHIQAYLFEYDGVDQLRFFHPTNGIEISGSHYTYNQGPLYNETDLLRTIDHYMSILSHESQKYEEYQFLPIQRAIRIGDLGEKKYFIAPISYSSAWKNSVFFDFIWNAYAEQWRSIFPPSDTLLNDPYYRKAAASLIDPHSVITHSCNLLLDSLLSSPPQNELALFDVIGHLASQTYESEICHGQIGFVPSHVTDMDLHENAICFISPIEFTSANTRELRKLLELTQDNTSLLLKGESVIGVGPNTLTHAIIRFSGSSKWGLYIDENPIFTIAYNRCILKQPYDEINLQDIYNKTFPETSDSFTLINEIIEAAKTQKHGTSLIISNNATRETSRLCEVQRGIAIDPINLAQHINKISALTAIDGALLMDNTGICYSLGIIVDGEAFAIGSAARGARYNSLLNYVVWKKVKDSDQQYLVIIISEDSTMDVFSTATIDLDEFCLSVG